MYIQAPATVRASQLFRKGYGRAFVAKKNEVGIEFPKKNEVGFEFPVYRYKSLA